MHSLKNTVVAVGLLALSFGLYQVSLKPNAPLVDVPSLDISEGINGIGDLASQGIEAAQSKIASAKNGLQIPELPKFGDAAGQNGSPKSAAGLNLTKPNFAKTNLTPPALPTLPNGITEKPGLPNSNLAQSTTPNSFGEPAHQDHKHPVHSTTQGGVQSINYPENANAKNSLGSTEKPAGQTEFSQRQSVQPTSDQGLIEALKSQQDFEAAMAGNQTASPKIDVPNSADFAAAAGANTQAMGGTQPVNVPNSIPNSSAPSDSDSIYGGSFGQSNSQPLAAQQIAANDSNFSNSSFTGLASNTAPDSDSGIDAGVQQANSEPNFSDLDFNAAWPKVDELIAGGDFRTALELLSRFYHNENLSGPQRQRLLAFLDALAGKVIFSQENHLANQPYLVQPNETLADVAAKWNVTPQLIANVHSQKLADPNSLAQGTQLKAIPGPFHAEVDLQEKVLTLFLGKLYAGRFPISVGISGTPQPGTFKVLVKSEVGHAWRDSGGVEYAPGTPENGYGPHWMGLTGSLCIHAVSEGATDGHHGCIGLNANDAKDLYAILAENCDIKIVR